MTSHEKGAAHTAVRTDIFVGVGSSGLPDGDTALDTLRDCVAGILSRAEVGFSITNQVGGYLHSDRTLEFEDSIRISLIGTLPDDLLGALVGFLKEEFHQESVLVVKEKIDVQYLGM